MPHFRCFFRFLACLVFLRCDLAVVSHPGATLCVTQAAAEAVGKPAEIDWDHYRERLPALDIDSFKENYEAYLSKIPAVTYDESADLAEHSKQVRGFCCCCCCCFLPSSSLLDGCCDALAHSHGVPARGR